MRKLYKLSLIVQTALLSTYASATIDLGGALIGSDGSIINISKLSVASSIVKSQVTSTSVISPPINIGIKNVVLSDGKTYKVPSITVNGVESSSNIIVNGNYNVERMTFSSSPNNSPMPSNLVASSNSSVTTQTNSNQSCPVGSTSLNCSLGDSAFKSSNLKAATWSIQTNSNQSCPVGSPSLNCSLGNSAFKDSYSTSKSLSSSSATPTNPTTSSTPTNLLNKIGVNSMANKIKLN